MRIAFSGLMLCFALYASAQQDSFTIKGVLKGLGEKRVTLSFTGDDGKSTNYSSNGIKDAFSFKVKKQKTFTIARFFSTAQKDLQKKVNGTTYGNPSPSLDVFVSGSDLTITGEIEYLHLATIKGDKENDSYSVFKKSVGKIDRRESDAKKQVFLMEDADSVEKKKIMKEVAENSRKKTVLQKKFIHDNPTLFTSLFMLSRMENYFTTGDYEQAYTHLADDYKQHPIGQKLAKRIEFVSPTNPGKQAVQFVRNDKDGKEVNLANYKGKIVLLDFWGSWCSPCRASHPHLKELYSKYKDKGFEIIAIASETAKTLDEQKKKWLEAIEKDGVNWVHILNNDGKEKQDLVGDYRVNAFPTKILLDTDGKILLRVTASVTDDIDKMLEKKLGF